MADTDPYFLGLDIGGTKLSASVILDNGEVLNLGYHPLASLDQLGESANRLLDSFSIQGAQRVGVAVAAWVSSRSKSPVFSPHRPELIRTDFVKLLGLEGPSRIVVDNDANCAAFSELDLLGDSTTAVVNFGTGIGMAIVQDGELLRGSEGFAGELGHCYAGGVVICECGARGCLESELRACFVTSADTLDIAQTKMSRYVELGAMGLSWVIRILNPREIVVGGGVPLFWENFVGDLIGALPSYIPASQSFTLPLVRPSLHKEYSGSVGAALMARSNLQ